ncbi:MAG: right-handed parallel beta-helix repeat-containing protein [Opitutaceae bacterium]
MSFLLKRLLSSLIVFAVGFIKAGVAGDIVRSSELGWSEGDDITFKIEEALNEGNELLLEHTYRIRLSHEFPDNFTLSAKKGAVLEVDDHGDSRKSLFVLGSSNTLRNVKIRYLHSPPIGPTGEIRGFDFLSRVGIAANGKSDILIEDCEFVGSINHHFKIQNCENLQVRRTRIAGGHWAVYLDNIDGLIFSECLIEKCQGDGIKTGGGVNGVVRNVLIENCVFQDNLRDGIDTTGGFNNAVISGSIFRRMQTSGLDIKSHYEMGEIFDHPPENVGIRVEGCVFLDMPNAIVISALDVTRDKIGKTFLTAANIHKYAPHDIEIKDCVFGFVERPLLKAHEGGYGVNYPGRSREHMRMLYLKDGYNIRYRNVQFFGVAFSIFGSRFSPIKISSSGVKHLSKQAIMALDRTVEGNIVKKDKPKFVAGDCEIPFKVGPK